MKSHGHGPTREQAEIPTSFLRVNRRCIKLALLWHFNEMMTCFPAARYLGCRIKIEVRSNVNMVVIVEVVVEGFCVASFSLKRKDHCFLGSLAPGNT